VAREIRGDFSGAVADYDKAIELKPDYSEWERLYRHTLLWRLDQPPQEDANTLAGRKQSPGQTASLKPVVVYGVAPDGVGGCNGRWTKTLGQFLVGRLDEKALLGAAQKSDASTVSEKKALACYYIGMKHLATEDKAGARRWFQKCRAAEIKDDHEYYFAVAELKRMDDSASR
jgi:hypothetical protein